MIIEPGTGMPVNNVPHTHNTSYVEWSAVIAGAVLAASVSIVLLQFGSAVGLAITSPLRGEGTKALTAFIATGIWLLWVQLTASIAGGYLAGRMRAPMTGFADHERDVRDGTHGLLSWATTTLVVFTAVSIVGAIAALAPEHANTAAATTTDHTIIVTKNTAVIAGFVTAAVSLISGVAAWWAGTMGGHHRDTGANHSHLHSFRR